MIADSSPQWRDAEPEPVDRRPAYVRRLDGECRAAKAELYALEAGIQDLIVYLHSAKFAVNHYVNRDDVLLRIEEARNAALQARGAAA